MVTSDMHVLNDELAIITTILIIIAIELGVIGIIQLIKLIRSFKK